MRGSWRDVVFGCRGFVRKPGFTAAALASLMLGIGTCTAIFALLDAIFLRPLPFADLERLVAVYGMLRNEAGEYVGEHALSYPNYRDLREQSTSFSHLALYQWGRMNLTGGQEPQRVTGMFVTGNYFELLGIEPAHGRLFEPGDDEETSDPVAVLAHGCWQRLFGGDPGVVGETLTVNGHTMTIAGVAPRGFRGTEMLASVDVFLPLQAFERVSPWGSWFDNRGVSLFPALGKLRPGVTREQAGQEIHELARRLAATYPESLENRLGGKVAPLAESTIHPRFRGRFEGYAMRLLIVLVILLIACLSVANLLFVRGVERARELSVRQALGAGRGRLVRQLLTENLVLFLFGGLGGLVVAKLALTLLWALRPPDVPATALDLRLDAAVWLAAVGTGLVLGLVFGLWPALRAVRADLVANLKESEPMAAKGLPLLLQPRSLVVMLQVALALVALIGSGLLLRSLERIFEIDLGFDSERLAVVTVSPGEQGYEEAQTREIYRRLLERTRALPGVEGAALSENRLLRGAVLRREIYLPGREPAIEFGHSHHRVNIVSPGFFATAGIPLLQGRDFTDNEPDDQRVAIVNQTMADEAWPDVDPIGQRFHFDYPHTPPIEVVGVVADAKYREVREDDQFFVYTPLDQNLASTVTLHARTAGEPEALLPTLSGVVREIDPELVLADLGTMDDFVAEALWLERTSTKLLGGFGMLALVLAVVGVYGLVAYSVSRRQRELGIQIALGARRGRVLSKVLLEALQVVAAGVVLGIVAAAFVLEPIMASQLYGVDVIDVPTYLTGPLVLLAVAILGSLLPAWRAARTNPIEALRAE